MLGEAVPAFGDFVGLVDVVGEEVFFAREGRCGVAKSGGGDVPGVAG